MLGADADSTLGAWGMAWIRFSRAVGLLAALWLPGCEAIFPNTTGFRQTRYYATGEVKPGTVDYSVLFCPDGRVDMLMSGYGVYGTYEVNRNTVVVRTRYNEVRFLLSSDRNTLTPDAGGLPLTRVRAHEASDPDCDHEELR
jgi:hypothetical protein